MRIQSICQQTFGTKDSYMFVRHGIDDFYSLSDFDKLDVIYDMLKEQKKDLKTLSENQKKMHTFNQRGFALQYANGLDNKELANVKGKILDAAAPDMLFDKPASAIIPKIDIVG